MNTNESNKNGFIALLGCNSNSHLMTDNKVIIQQNTVADLTSQDQQFLHVDSADPSPQFVQFVDENGEVQYIQLTQENQDQILQILDTNAEASEEGQVFLEQQIMQSIQCLEANDDGTYSQIEGIESLTNDKNMTIDNGSIEENVSAATEGSGDMLLADDINCNINQELKCPDNTEAKFGVTVKAVTDGSLIKSPLLSIVSAAASTSDYISQQPLTSATMSEGPEEADTLHIQIYDATGVSGTKLPQSNSGGVSRRKQTEVLNKEPDLSSPIALTAETTVYVKGKKCVLRVDPQSNQLVAYPVKSDSGSTTKRGKGRPRKQRDEEENTDSELSEGFTLEKESHALEGLLGLSDVGSDGRRKSHRMKKKPKVLVEEYEVEAVDDEDESKVSASEATCYVEELDPQTGVLIRKQAITEDKAPRKKLENRIQNNFANTGLPVKRGRGRPRLNAPKDPPSVSGFRSTSSANPAKAQIGSAAKISEGKTLQTTVGGNIGNSSSDSTSPASGNTTLVSNGNHTKPNTINTSSNAALTNGAAKRPITVKFVDKMTGKVVPGKSVKRLVKEEGSPVVVKEKKGDDSRLQVKRNKDGTLTVLYDKNTKSGEDLHVSDSSDSNREVSSTANTTKLPLPDITSVALLREVAKKALDKVFVIRPESCTSPERLASDEAEEDIDIDIVGEDEPPQPDVDAENEDEEENTATNHETEENQEDQDMAKKKKVPTATLR